jgi:hypothetical protein
VVNRAAQDRPPLFFGALMHCETVKVVTPVSDQNPHGYIVINKSDLTDKHEIFDAKPVKATRKTKKTDE